MTDKTLSQILEELSKILKASNRAIKINPKNTPAQRVTIQ